MRARTPTLAVARALFLLALALARPAAAQEVAAAPGAIGVAGRERPGWAGGPSAVISQPSATTWTGFTRATAASPPSAAVDRPARVPAVASTTTPPLRRPVPPSVVGRARAEIVIDLATGRVLHEADADVPARPASLAKLMTLEMLFSAMDEGVVSGATLIPVSQRAAAMPPTRLGLAAGSSIPAREAALCLAVHSCNDVATAVAEYLVGNEDLFAAAMTETARRLGLSATSFGNASGLPDPRNYSTARDLALLGAGIVARHPRMLQVLGTARWGYGEASFRNTSRLIGTHPLIRGGKTGYVRESGYNMLAFAEAPDGRRVLAVVLGGATAGERDARVSALVEAGIAAVARPAAAPRHAAL